MRTRNVIFILLLVILLAFLLFPIYWMIVTSFKTNLIIYRIPPQWIPHTPTIASYVGVFSNDAFLIYFANNFLVAFFTTLLTIFAAVPAGYSLSRYHTRFGRGVGLGLLSTQMFPVIGIVIALYTLFRSIHLLNTRVGLILALTALSIPFCVWLIKGFFDDIPRSIEEAARMEGASRMGILVRIVVPLSKPGLLAMGLYTFMLAWNDFLVALTLIISDHLRTLSVGIAFHFLGEVSYDWALVSTASVVGTLPMFLLFFIFQRYMVSGLTAGAVKG